MYRLLACLHMDLSQRLIRMEQLVSVRCNGCLCDLLVDYL